MAALLTLVKDGADIQLEIITHRNVFREDMLTEHNTHGLPMCMQSTPELTPDQLFSPVLIKM